MNIVTIPHQILRTTAQPVAGFSEELRGFLADLQTTLQQTDRPRGVGLAAPQVNVPLRIFATQLEENQITPEVLINPVIVGHGNQPTLGPDPEHPQLEGCLSMPLLYGPVPRWEWVEVEYHGLIGDQLVEKKERFDGFHARVVQHEIDHLDGILFTDYSLQYDLPVYREEGKELVEITDRGVLELY